MDIARYFRVLITYSIVAQGLLPMNLRVAVARDLLVVLRLIIR